MGDELLRLAARQLIADKDSNINRALDEDITRRYRESHAPPVGRKKVLLRIQLNADEKDTLCGYFPEIEISYHNTNLYSHGYAAASRKLELEVLLTRCIGANEKIVDIGGNWADHIAMNRHHIHSCCPILDARDSARDQERTMRIERIYASLVKNRSPNELSKLAAHKYIHNPEVANFYCHKKAQDCRFQARRGIALHSIYDIPFDDLGAIMDAHSMDSLHGTFIFYPAILNPANDGQPLESKELQAVAIKYESEDAIEFTFKSDSSNCYRHKYSNYLKYITRTYTTHHGSLFFYELMENRGGIQFFKLIRCTLIPQKPINRQAKYIWLGNEEVYAVKVYDYGLPSGKKLKNSDPMKDLTVDYVIVDKLTYERALEHALGTKKDGSDLFEAIYNYMRSINNRVIVNGVNVSSPKRVTADALYKLATAVYCHTVFMKYCANQVRVRIEDQMKAYFSILKSGFWSLLGQWLKESISIPGDELHDHVIGPFRKFLIMRMNAVKDRPEYGMQDFYIRFSDYVNVNLTRDVETLRQARLTIEEGLLEVYQKAVNFRFSPELCIWIRELITQLPHSRVFRYQSLIREVNRAITNYNRERTSQMELVQLGGDPSIMSFQTATTSFNTPRPSRKITINETITEETVRSDEPVPSTSGYVAPSTESKPDTDPVSTSLNSPSGSVALSVAYTTTESTAPLIGPLAEQKVKYHLPKWFKKLTVFRKATSDTRPPKKYGTRRRTASSVATQESSISDTSSLCPEARTAIWVDAIASELDEQETPTLIDLADPLNVTDCVPVRPLEERHPGIAEIFKTSKTTTTENDSKDVTPENELSEQDPEALKEYELYLEAERNAITAVGLKLWSMVLSQHTKQPQFYNLNAAYLQHECAVLEKLTNGDYKAFRPSHPSCGVACGEYDMCFDGEKFVDCIHYLDRNNDFYKVESDSQYLIVWKDTRLLQCVHLLETIKTTRPPPNASAIITLVEGVPGCGKTTEIIARAGEKDLILTVARKTKEEIAGRLPRGSKTKVRTVDSYILNDRNMYDRVFLDEGLMIHAGLIDMISNYTKCRELLVFGDRNQLNFTCRVSDFEVKHHIREEFHRYEMRNTSYRCPKDVARMFSPVYDGGFDTTNNINKSLTLIEIQNLGDVDKNHEKYLVFTQEEKKELQKMNFRNVNTVHECQGTTYKDVALVRLTYKSFEIYSRMKYILVAMTRHTQTFTYYTIKKGDVTASLINATRTVHAKDMEDSKAEYSRVNKGLKNMEMILNVEEQVTKICGGEVSALREAIISTEHFKINDNTGLFTQLKSLNQEIVEREKVEPTKRKKAVLSALQTYYDSVLPNASTEYTEYDEYQVQHSDLELNLENLKFNLARDGEKAVRLTKEIAEYKPLLRTGQPNKRMSDFRQAALAIMKRNCDTPRNALPSEFKTLFCSTIESMSRLFFRPDHSTVFESYQNNPIATSPEGIEQWLCAQEPLKLKRINMEQDFVNLDKMMQYHMMVKGQAKNKLEPAAIFEYQSPQNIVYHESSINAIFGPMFKVLYQRFINLLAPNVCVMLQKSHNDLENHMTTFLDPTKEYDKLEIDFSKFDKSQTEVCFEIEMAIWNLLGMDEYMRQLWKLGHFSVSATDFAAGIKAYLLYQRKSGDSATAFGNTIISMASVAYSAVFPYVEAAYFIGDDSLIYLDRKYDHSSMPSTLSKTFNLSSKILEMNTGYFCSMFIIQTTDKFKVIPDPLKRIEKLGMIISVNEEEDLRQRYVSFKELIDPLADDTFLPAIISGMNERYGNSDSTQAALEALRIAASDFRIFSTLYQKVDC